MKNKLSTKQGFTIIEVVLVLAIAGLIFLMVFVAFPALQRNQRDAQRRQDYADLSAAILSYAANNNGTLPAKDTTLPANKYLNTTGKDPSGSNYTLNKVVQITASAGAPTAAPAANNVYVYTYADCSGTVGGASPKFVNNSKKFAIYGYLESGSYCYAGQI